MTIASRVRLGCIADDFTGATDLANSLVRGGLRVLQTFGVPYDPSRNLDDAADVDAIVVALKTRTAPVADAVRDSLAASDWLRDAGATQQYFKVCSTFDSTPRGNIGPVLEALMDRLGAPFCVVTPAFPDAGRTVYQGHLFVGEQLLSDSPMRQHPLTPMTDASLLRVLQAQLRHRRIGLLAHATVRQGVAAVAARIEDLRRQGLSMAIADAVQAEDLIVLGAALREAPLVCAGSGLATGLAAAAGASSRQIVRLAPPRGAQAIVSGSCSAATNAQVAHFMRHGGAAFSVDPLRLAGGPETVAQLVKEALDWARTRLGAAPVLIYATATPEAVDQVQRALGIDVAGQLVEEALARIAVGLVEAGVGQLIVAGGETSGACVQALGIRRVRVGAQIDPGVPWCHASESTASQDGLHIALKSGNFGGPDFFTRAFSALMP